MYGNAEHIDVSQHNTGRYKDKISLQCAILEGAVLPWTVVNEEMVPWEMINEKVVVRCCS